MKRFAGLSAALLATALAATACASPQADGGTEDTIKIGYAGGFTGPISGFDGGALTGAQLAVDQINASGGVLGRELELITADTKSDIDEGARAAQELIAQGVQAMLVTADYNFGSPAAIEAQGAGIVAISTGAGSPKFGVEGIGPLAYTMGQSGVSDGAVMAEWAYEERDARDAYLLLDDTTDYDKDQCRGFKTRWLELGGSVQGEDTFKNSDTSINAQITRLVAAGTPDIVALCSYAPGGAVAIKQLRDAGVDSLIATGGGMDGDFWFKDAMPELSNVAFPASASVWGNDPEERVNEFVEEFIAADAQPQHAFGLYAYAAVQALALAMERAGSTEGEVVAAELDSFKAEDLLIPVTFTPELHIDTQRPSRIIEIVGGSHELAGEWSLESVPPLFAD